MICCRCTSQRARYAMTITNTKVWTWWCEECFGKYDPSEEVDTSTGFDDCARSDTLSL